MQTYNSINQAFKNGQGDVFFQENKTQKFICIHRKDETTFRILEKMGFTYLTYEQTMQLAEIQNLVVADDVQKVIEYKTPKYDNFYKPTCQSYSDQFYEEFPDAYGQNL